MTISKLLFFSQRKTVRSFHKKSKFHTDALAETLFAAIDDLNIDAFKEAIIEAKEKNISPAKLYCNNKPVLIEICSKLAEKYQERDKGCITYKFMLSYMRGSIHAEHYTEYFEGNTPLTLLAKVNDLSIAWHLNQMLVFNKTRIGAAAEGINGTNDVNKDYYLKDIPLVHAIKAGSPFGAHVLLNNGANANIIDFNKQTPLDHAKDELTRKLLLNAGASNRIRPVYTF